MVITAELVDLIGEVLRISRTVTTPYGGVHNIDVGDRNLLQYNVVPDDVSYDATGIGDLPGITEDNPNLVQWWDISTDSGIWEANEIGGSDKLINTIMLRGYFGWTVEPIGGIVKVNEGEPTEIEVPIPSEMVWNTIVEALALALNAAGNYQLNNLDPTVEIRGNTQYDTRIITTGEAFFHFTQIRLLELERKVF